jgi:hypothetical protein
VLLIATTCYYYQSRANILIIDSISVRLSK